MARFLKVLAIVTLVAVVIMSAIVGAVYYQVRLAKRQPEFYIDKVTVTAGLPYVFTRRGAYYTVYPPKMIDGVMYVRVEDLPLIFGGVGNVTYGISLDYPKDITVVLPDKKVHLREGEKDIILSYGSSYLLHEVKCIDYICMVPLRELAEILGRKVEQFKEGTVLVIHNGH